MKKKIENIQETFMLNAVVKRKIHGFMPSINYGNFSGNSEILLAMFKTDM